MPSLYPSFLSSGISCSVSQFVFPAHRRKYPGQNAKEGGLGGTSGMFIRRCEKTHLSQGGMDLLDKWLWTLFVATFKNSVFYLCSKRMNMFPGFPICHTVLAHFRENIFLVLMFRHSVGTIAALVGIVSTWHWYSRGINPVVSEGNPPFRKLAHLHHY